MGKPETVPPPLILPDRRLRKRDRRAQGDRREAIRWGEGNDRRKRKRDRRKSMRGAWDRLPP